MQNVRSELLAGAALAAAMLIGFGLSALPAQAGYIVTLEQVGSNVVASGSGTIDLTDLTRFAQNSGVAIAVVPNVFFIQTGQIGVGVDEYQGITGPGVSGAGARPLPISAAVTSSEL
jgi:hypothetical protein